jgi:hypothetical protein
MHFKSLRCIAIGILLLAGSPVLAQTGADLLIKPWPDDVRELEVRGDALFLGPTHVKKSGDDFTLGMYEAEGRFRIIPGEVVSPRVGFDVKYFDLNKSNNGLPDQLTDQSVALGAGVLKTNGWIFALKGGIGYAGPTPFTDGNAFYGLFDFVVGKQLSENSQIGFVVDYDGNRSKYRDIPIPGFAYRFWNDPRDIEVAIGFPYTSIDFHPIPHSTFSAVLSIPDDLSIYGSYEVIPNWSVFGSISKTIDTFYLDSTASVRDRLFFQQRRAEVGVAYTPNDFFDFRLAAGYAWDQEFSVGFSSSRTTLVEDIADKPYVRLGLVWKY